MAIYTVATYHNPSDSDFDGGHTEYDIDTFGDLHTEGDVNLRLLEATCINLAQLAESAQRIARSLEQMRAGV